MHNKVSRAADECEVLEDAPAMINDAELLGVNNEDMQTLLQRPAVFMTGSMYGQKDRRNTQDGDWKRVELPWLGWLVGEDKGPKSWGLTRHPIAKAKEGPSIVLADSIDGARTDAAIKTMYAIGLDIDSGAKLDDVLDKLEELGVFAVVYTSFSHGKDELVLKFDDVVRKLKLDGEPTLSDIQTYLREYHKDRYDESFIETVEIVELRKRTKDGQRTILKTQPLDKFRVILPFWEPIQLADLGTTQQQQKDAWADAVTGVAVNMLGVNFDTSCTDAPRLFFTPRHPKDADEWYCAVVQGRPLRFDEIERYSKDEYVKNRGDVDPFADGTGDAPGAALEEILAPSGLNLRSWHRQHKERFLIADVIEAFCDDKIRVAGNEKAGTCHIECPFEHEHSSEGGTATLCMNPDETDAGYWTVFCKHDSCQSRDKLEFLAEMLAQNWFDESVLTDDEWNVPLADEDADAPAFNTFEPSEDWLPAPFKYGKDLIFIEQTNDDGDKVHVPVCGVFDVVGRSADLTGTMGAARIISFKNENGKRVELTITRADLYATPKEVWEQLSDAGLYLPGRDKKSMDRVLDLLAQMTPQRLVPTLTTPGWVRDDAGQIVGFMYPTGDYEARDGQVMRLHEDSTVANIVTAGTLAGWSDAANAALSHVADNPYWTLTTCAGFSGAILGILDWNPMGFHLSGETTKGKTLGQIVAASIHASPKDGDGVLWGASSTPNAYEDLAVYGTHTCLMMDDLGAVPDKKALAPLMFALHSGRSKARKRGNGAGLTHTVKFCPFVVFSSEASIKNEVEAAGVLYRGGMAVRFPDIDAGCGKTRTGDELAKIEAVKRNFGHAGPAFVRYLMNAGICDDPGTLEKEIDAITAELADGKSPGLRRAARPFAVAQRAGELAVEAGLLNDVEAVRDGVSRCWELFLKSDEAATANGSESLMDGFTSWVHSQLDVTIIPASGVPGSEPSNSDGRGRVVGWYTDDHIILDWKAMESVSIPGTFGKRTALCAALDEMGALERASETNVPFSNLPPEVGTLPGKGGAKGAERRVKNMRIRREKLGV